MKHTEDHSWENGWRETLREYDSSVCKEDWSGMEQLLDARTSERKEVLVDTNLPRFPESAISRFLKLWPQSLLAVFLIGGLGFGLGQCRADNIIDEMIFFKKNADEGTENQTHSSAVCPPGPNYRVVTYQTFNESGFPTGVFVSDTIWWNTEKENSQINFSGTYTPAYRFDTIYQLDEYGNLSDSIYSIDTSKYLPVPHGN